MRNMRLLVGMPVICEGRKLGRVIQAQVSEDLTHMTGLFIAIEEGNSRRWKNPDCQPKGLRRNLFTKDVFTKTKVFTKSK